MYDTSQSDRKQYNNNEQTKKKRRRKRKMYVHICIYAIDLLVGIIQINKNTSNMQRQIKSSFCVMRIQKNKIKSFLFLLMCIIVIVNYKKYMYCPVCNVCTVLCLFTLNFIVIVHTILYAEFCPHREFFEFFFSHLLWTQKQIEI